MVTRTKRIDMRADPDSAALITAAAAARRVSVSAFVLEAAPRKPAGSWGGLT